MSDAMNKNAIKTLIGAKGVKGAVQLTPKATRARIRSDLGKTYSVDGRAVKLVFLLASKELKRQGIGKGMSRETWRATVAATAELIFKRRDASRAFIAAGWLNAVRDLGRTSQTGNRWGDGTTKKVRGVQVKPGGAASKSFGIPATPSRVTFLAVNAAVSDGGKDWQIADKALQAAIKNATADVISYLNKRQEDVLRRNSDK